MIAEHGATVLQFTHPVAHGPERRPGRGVAVNHGGRNDGPLPDNVIVLARFSRRPRTHRPTWVGGPPEGEAA